MIIDAHQHVWDLERAPYPWLGEHVPQWNRTFTFEELAPQLARAGVGATVMVQSADNDADTDLMRAVADEHPEVVGIVVYVPLERPDEAAARLAALRADPRVVGVRNLIHDLPDPDWILRPEVDEGLGVLAAAGVTFDYVAVLPRHLEHVPTLCERHPDLRIVIDHLAKPPVGASADDREPWWSLVAAAAESPQVVAKVSGLYPGDAMDTWTPDGVRPFVERALELFGPARLMYGGDWPISVAAGGYDRVFAGLMEVLDGLGLDAADREQVLAGTATSFYRLDAGLLDAATRL
ncbi:amidohydrolase family protein [Nocardioides sp. KIGAM211]|uniref:Amidohydrolase family protein n=1 Tax=Nocardioides luti TaxID=2761101 RepID=A0A7X0RI10_9ACTN|nr:amidohydrolase family protein [Nocardioides luti]MBB6627710.1 amidohydrolase family protein [Nocardioides luti]